MDIYQLSVNGLVPIAGIQANILAYQLENAATHDEFEMAKDLTDSWGTMMTNYFSIMAQNVKVESLSCRRESAPGGPTYVASVNSFGLDLNDMEDSALAFNIRFIPATGPFRRKLGHFYCFGIAGSNLTDNAWNPGFIPAVQAFGDGLIPPIPSTIEPTNNWLLSIYDRTSHVATRVAHCVASPKPMHIKKRMRPWPV